MKQGIIFAIVFILFWAGLIASFSTQPRTAPDSVHPVSATVYHEISNLQRDISTVKNAELWHSVYLPTLSDFHFIVDYCSFFSPRYEMRISEEELVDWLVVTAISYLVNYVYGRIE